MKTDTEEVYNKLLAAPFSLNWKTYTHFCSYRRHNLQNTYQREKCFEQKQTYSLYSIHFSASLIVFEINWILWIHFQICMFDIHRDAPIMDCS